MRKAKRQLLLPGLPRSSTPPGDRMKRAKRDFTATEFERAIERNGFHRAGGTLSFVDTRDPDAKWISGVVRRNPIRLARRATLAKLIRAREAADQ